MRWARSYSIVDHELLHKGYLHRLSHEAMVLYLFLVLVGDREGRSFYGDTTIMKILRLDEQQINSACQELLEEGLIEYRRPYWWVKNIEGGQNHERRIKRKGFIPARCNEADLSSDR